MKFSSVLAVSTLAVGLQWCATSFAEETTMEKAGTTTQKGVNAVKKTYRGALDKGCEMVNGKVECAGKKLKHKAQNLMDDAKVKTDETVNKVD